MKKGLTDKQKKQIIQALFNQHMHLFPETRDEVKRLEQTPGFNDIEVPEVLKDPSWLFSKINEKPSQE